MSIELPLRELERILENIWQFFFHVPAPSWLLPTVITLAILSATGLLKVLLDVVKSLYKAIRHLIGRFTYDQDTKDFIRVRSLFANHLIREVIDLNIKADWNDFHYVALEAEVEVDPALDVGIGHANPIVIVWWFLRRLPRALLRITPAARVEKNLVIAIQRSKSRAFLVIGDPGTGKTVSLRHLFLRMAEDCAASRAKNAVIPIYLNLKRLNAESRKSNSVQSELTADKVRAWILKELSDGQDRSINEFLARNFESILNRGQFFFIFDSFDEIPAVMDALEETEVVQLYAQALDRFLHGTHGCRGLVASRPYRSPRTFIGQKLTIRPLPDKRIKEALGKYLIQERPLAEQLWHQLVYQRDDLLSVARNPFYLSLLARYVKDNANLPARQYDLFEYFIQSRASSDEERLRTFGLTADELINRASVLAYAMTQATEIGLEAQESQLSTILSEYVPSVSWCDAAQVKSLLGGLAYSKLGYVSQERSATEGTFSFIHRRFHEYLTARYIRGNPESVPLASVAEDNRWREVLVLLAEVLPQNQLEGIVSISQAAIATGIQSVPGTPGQRKGIEALRFLRDGFRSRLDDLPKVLRQLCSLFIGKQFIEGNLLDQKRAVENIIVADDDSIPTILTAALNSDSTWIRDVALRSCRNVSHSSTTLEKGVRAYLYEQYSTLRLLRDVANYRSIFSSSTSLSTAGIFVNLAWLVSLAQIILLVLVTGYWLLNGFGQPVFFIPVLLIVAIVVALRRIYGRGVRLFRYIGNTWVILCLLTVAYLATTGITRADVLRVELLRQVILDCVVAGMFFGLDRGLETLTGRFPKNLRELFSLPLIRIPQLVMRVVILIVVFFISAEFLPRLVGSFMNSVLGESTVNILELVLLVIFVVSSVAILMLAVASGVVRLIHDQVLLTVLFAQSNRRPSNGMEVIQELHNFKTIDGKTRFIHAVPRWLPYALDTKLVLAEADKQDRMTRDALYQLVEIWEDSEPKSLITT